MDLFSGALDLINNNNASTVFIDDTGSLENGIISYSGVIIQPEYSKDIPKIMHLAIKSLNQIVKASEFHFKDIYQGHGEFEGVDIKVRNQILYKFAELLSRLNPAVFFITADKKTVEEFYKEQVFPKGTSQRTIFSSYALGNLIERIDNYLINEIKTDKKAVVFCDNGFKESGNALQLPIKVDSIYSNSIFFIDSKAHPGIQLADFTAYTLNRYQFLAKKEKLSSIDVTFILQTEALKPLLKNVTILGTENILLNQEFHLPFILRKQFEGKSDRTMIIGDTRTGMVTSVMPKKK